jgi:hypothetical protein
MNYTSAFLFFPDGGESPSLLVKVDRGPKDEPDATQFGIRYSVSIVTSSPHAFLLSD